MTFPVAGAAGVDLGEATVCLRLQHTVQATTATVVLRKRTSRS
jgi:hypothetical protein